MAVMNILRNNTPKYFAPSEEVDFEQYLDSKLEDYFVLASADEILGCGGINYINDKIACLSWDMVKPSQHSKGLGRLLVEHRINFLEQRKNISLVIVRTSQHTFKFYEKFGFRLLEVQKDYWAPNFDLYDMEMHL